MPIDEASRQNSIPPGLTIRQVPRSIASNCGSRFGEVQDRAADDDVGERFGKRHAFDRLVTKVAGRQLRRECLRQALYRLDRRRVAVGSEDLIAGAQQKDDVAAAAASGIEDAHARPDSPAQQLIEQVDVDVAELFAEVVHGE